MECFGFSTSLKRFIIFYRNFLLQHYWDILFVEKQILLDRAVFTDFDIGFLLDQNLSNHYTQQYPDAKGLKYGEKIIDSNQNFDTLDGFIRSFYKDSEILSQFCK